jgi:two-component system, NarL family, response regulator DevR
VEETRTRIFLLDDHELVRDGLRSALEADGDMQVVGEASTAEEALRRIPGAHPEVAILDMRLPDGSGIEVCREIRSRMPEVSCVILTSFADDEALSAAIMAGASGYILKQLRARNVVEDIRKVASGSSLLDPAMRRRMFERMRTSEDPAIARLTGQERRILDQIAEGRTNRQIAKTLYLAEKTVKNYVTNILMKLGVERRTEAAVYATRIEERKKGSVDRAENQSWPMS